MTRIGLVFPHQLFEQTPLSGCESIHLIEETLFFKQLPFHPLKIAFHRASMRFYEGFLRETGHEVTYIESSDALSDVRLLLPHLHAQGVRRIEIIEPTDTWLEQRIAKACKVLDIELITHPSPMFLNSTADIAAYAKNKKRLFQTDFYKQQRLKRNILMEADGTPAGGKWTYDDENRLRYPKGKTPPKVDILPYPTTHEESQRWLRHFLATRFAEFGAYEDAIVVGEPVLHHSVLTPMLNVGLLTPQQVIDEALDAAASQGIPLNSVEGFIRQIIGWREFIRMVYTHFGTQERTRNYWGFTRKIPASFWTGTTGIEPVDASIRTVLDTGYCHHIERLMVLGNFMLLCEFDPDEVYRWFMEMFIDAYDWVMVPNVYGMSQFADGGLMSTKPYISGSNYILKMSDHKKGDWQPIWDGLFWRFMHVHRDFFLKNPRLGMLVKQFDAQPEAKRQAHLDHAERWLASLDAAY